MTEAEWHDEYEAAWDTIRHGLGDLGDHIEEARAFLGDVALLDLMKRFDPGEVIIAQGIELVRCILGPDGEREVGARSHNHPEEPIVTAVREAHQRLVEIEGDQHWRRIVPPDARERIVHEIERLKAADAQ